MTDLRKAAQDMLETLNEPFTASKTIFQAKEALRQALDQEKPPVKSYCGGKPNYCTEPEDWAKQEPVAWMHKENNRIKDFFTPDENEDCENCEHCIPLYTAKQVAEAVEAAIKSRQWVGLTGDEQDDIERMANDPLDAICLTEAKLKEKNT